jgi:dTDP-4-amino-4,6-dideoxygalactose transaminase
MGPTIIQRDVSLPAVFGGEPLFQDKFRFIAPTLPDLDDVIGLYRNAYGSGMVTNAALVERFERAAAEMLGVGNCVAVSSCTSGLLLLLRALELTGEVILPSFTFFATGHAALWNGLKPVMVDCDPRTWTIDPKDVERNITSNTTAILAVHIYGNPCNVRALADIAARHRLKLIFDAAHAFGSCHQGEPVGRFGDAEVFSLSPTKTLVCGEGGLVATNDAALARRLRVMRNYGDPGTYDCEIIGLNARMSEFQAALGLAGLDLVEEKIRKHNEIAETYTNLLQNVRGLHFQSVLPGNRCTFKDYSVRVDGSVFGSSRKALQEALAAENIETRTYFDPPLHLQTLYRQFARRKCGPMTNTETLSRGVLSLPIYPGLDCAAAAKVARAIVRIADHLQEGSAADGGRGVKYTHLTEEVGGI